jgi:hypothetical protein
MTLTVGPERINRLARAGLRAAPDRPHRSLPMTGHGRMLNRRPRLPILSLCSKSATHLHAWGPIVRKRHYCARFE